MKFLHFLWCVSLYVLPDNPVKATDLSKQNQYLIIGLLIFIENLFKHLCYYTQKHVQASISDAASIKLLALT